MTDKKDLTVKSLENSQLAKKESFGGLTFKENYEKTQKAIANVVETEHIFNRSHSQWTWRHLNLSYASDFKNIRQISAEMSRKREALDEARFRYLKKQAEIEIKKEELEKEESHAKKLLLEIEIEEMKNQSANSMKYIEGAMKDVITLSSLYDDLKKKYEGLTEEEFEREEAKSHIKRAVQQCLRDIRATGRVTKGEQEYLEQIGINPSAAIADMYEYLKKEEKAELDDITGLYEFLDYAAEKYAKVCKINMALHGFKDEPLKEVMYSLEDNKDSKKD